MGWVAVAGLTITAALLVLSPLRRRAPLTQADAADVAFFRAQLAEIERDVGRGLLPSSEAAAARAEMGRKLLAATQAAQDAPPSPQRDFRLLSAASVLILLFAVAGVAYKFAGRPAMPDMPLSARLEDPSSPGIVEAMIARVESHLLSKPDDADAWAAIGNVYMKSERYDDAAKAFGEVLRIKGDGAPVRASYGEALIGVGGGVVTASARAAFDAALTLDPKNQKARYYRALAAEQDGDKAKAIEVYGGLRDELPKDAPAAKALSERIDELKAGPKVEEAKGIAGLPPEERAAAIRGMVERLADRLAAKGGEPQEWTRLIRSYSNLKEREKAVTALTEARKAFGSSAQTLGELEALAKELGLGDKP